jgi:hypothetical protein
MRTFTFIFCSLLFISEITGQGSANRPPTQNGVRASFVYCGADQNCDAANRVRQDIAADYVHGTNGVDAVFQLGSGSRDLTIKLQTSQRSLQLDFREMVNAGTVVPTWLGTSPVQLVKPGMNVLGAYYAKENCPPTSSDCHYTARFNIGLWTASGDNASTTYAIVWNPLASGRPVNSPDVTSYVDVHYIRDDGNGEVFIITPILTGAGYALSGLEQAKKKTVSGAGQFNMPFTLTVRPL